MGVVDNDSPRSLDRVGMPAALAEQAALRSQTGMTVYQRRGLHRFEARQNSITMAYNEVMRKRHP
jgi:hypothetical protein